ncbi:MAG: UvrD-helicase domain-containing protein, partial [Caldimicrobium sp.]
MMKDSITLFHASAGAGKTYQLSLNYLFLLKQFCQSNPEALKKILAITYTNKAAYEMKERIITFLKEIALQTDRGKVLSEKTGIDPSYAEFLLENLFLYYDYFEVRTIDSFLF